MRDIIHAYFNVRGMRGFYLSAFVRRIGLGLIGIYIPIYLYYTGYEIPSILFYYFIQSLSFVLFSPIGGKLLQKIGFKFGILLSIPFQLSSYLLLITIKEHPSIFFIVPVLTAITNFLFYVSYHSIFTKKSHHEKRGGEIATLSITVMLAGMIAPFLGGVIAEENFSLVFIVSSLFILIGSIPFFYMEKISRDIEFSIERTFSYLKKKECYKTFISFFSYGVEHIIDLVLWPIFIVSTVHSLEKTGLVVSITSGISILVYYAVGKMSDHFKKKKIITLASYLYAIFYTLRVFSINMKQLLIFDSIKSMTQKAVAVPFATRIYEFAEKSPNYLEFTIVKENVFNLARIVSIPFFILIFSISSHPFIVSFVITGILILGYRYIN